MPDKRGALPTQKFVEVDTVRKGTVVLKNGSLRQILMVSGVNLDLKSEEEQGIIINLFQAFLNSLNFSLQIVVHSRKLNIDEYLETLTERLNQETNELLKNQIEEYREFVRALVSENAIMNKTYLVVVPFDPVKIPGAGAASAGGLLGFLKKKPAAPEATLSERQLDEQIEQLAQRTAHVLAGIDRIGLRAAPLNDEELVELLYNFYNPEGIEKKELAILKESSEPQGDSSRAKP